MPIHKPSRRTFLASAAFASTFSIKTAAKAEGPRKKVAFLGTEVRIHSHAQHFLDRMTLGYSWASGWQMPRVDVASIYVDLHPKNDLAPQRIARHKLKLSRRVAASWLLMAW
jgi:hypothetical protein